MTATPAAVTVSVLVRMLREAFEGPPGPWTYFTDTSPGTGAFGTISGLSAIQASEPGGPGRTTIAGHVNHLSSSLALSTLGLRGQPTSRDRARSWTVTTVDDRGWADLQARLLLAAALCAKGKSIINGIEQIDRGYEALDRKLVQCGADIRRVAE